MNLSGEITPLNSLSETNGLHLATPNAIVYGKQIFSIKAMRPIQPHIEGTFYMPLACIIFNRCQHHLAHDVRVTIDSHYTLIISLVYNV